MKIEARNLTVGYGLKTVLSDVNFTAEAGKITVIIGPNGSGKTTLMRALSKDLPYSGEITLNGRDIARLHPAELASRRAILSQETTLAFPYTVAEIVRLGFMSADKRPIERSQVRQRIEEALDQVDLGGFSGRFYQELSGGERQRVQLARVLCQIWEPVSETEPHWLFLDEPVSSLDIKHQLLIMDVASAYARDGGGVISVMHDLNLTAMFADKIAAISNGGIAAVGPPNAVLTDNTIHEVYDCPLRVGFTPSEGRFVLPQSVNT